MFIVSGIWREDMFEVRVTQWNNRLRLLRRGRMQPLTLPLTGSRRRDLLLSNTMEAANEQQYV